MKYFRFEIPTHKDGTVAVYSEGWHGTMDRCPRDVTVLLYDHDKMFGIAQTEDTFIPPEVKEITKGEMNKAVAGAKSGKKVFKGDKIAKRFKDRELEYLEIEKELEKYHG